MALVQADAIVDLGTRLAAAPTLQALIANGLLGEARSILAQERGGIPLGDVVLERPIPAPGKILCVGVNYLDRNAEYKDGSEQPKNPSVFPRFAQSFVAHGAAPCPAA